METQPQDDPILESLSNEESEADAMALLNGANSEDALLAALEKREAEEAPKNEEIPEDAKVDVEEAEEEKPKYSKEELLRVFDQLMFEGEYTEQLEVVDNRIYATYRSRTVKESNYINATIDAQQFSTLLTLQNHQVLLTLAYALQQYSVTNSKGESTVRKVPTDPIKAYEKISKLPEAFIEALSRGMGEFDDKVREAVEYSESSF